MGQFKPMVKMMTTEPTVELKLKKGGTVKKMQAGGLSGMGTATAQAPAMPVRGGMAPARAPMRPSMAARRRAMMAMPAAAAPAAPVGMAGRMMKEGGESKAEHAAEMKKMAKTAKELKKHESMPASKAHKGLKTGGVVMGQGGYKAGGIIESKKGETMMHTAKVDHSPAKTGGVKLGNAGGYKTGGVAKANAGGYKKGGAAKKAYATGGVVKSGAPVAMPQGRKTPSKPVSISQLSGTFKKGGSVTPAEAKLLKAHKSENASAMKSAKAYNNEVYSKYGKNVKMAAGGDPADMPMKGSSMSPKKQFKAIKEDVEFISGDRPESEYSRLFPFGSTTTSKRRQVAKDLMKDSDIGRFAAPGYGDAGQFYKHGGKTKKYSQGGSTSSAEDQAKTARNQKAYENWERIQREENEGMRNAILGAPKKMIEGIKGFFSKPPEGSVTKTEKSVTVTPAKKRGGSV